MARKISEFGKFEILLVFLVTFVAFAIRYMVKRSQDFLMNVDSYYYVGRIQDGIYELRFMEHFGYVFGLEGLLTMLMYISILTVPIFYYACRQYTSYTGSFIGALGFALSPLIFFNNQFGILDKNVPTLFMIVAIIAVFGRFKKDVYRIIILIPLLLLFAFIWNGVIGIIALIAIYYFIESLIKKQYILTILYTSFGLICMAWNLKVFINMSDYFNIRFISELNPIWNIGIFWEYIIIVILWILVLTKLRLEKYDKEKLLKYLFLYIGFIVMFFGMCFVFRMNIFFLPFLYIWLAIIFDDLEYKDIYKFITIGCIFLIISILSLGLYIRDPVMNKDILDAMEYINTLNETNCVIGSWGKGMIYDAYTDKKVPFRGSADGFNTEILYMVEGNNTTCVIIWDNQTIAALNYVLIYTGKDINTSEYYINKYENESVKFGDVRVLHRYN